MVGQSWLIPHMRNTSPQLYVQVYDMGAVWWLPYILYISEVGTGEKILHQLPLFFTLSAATFGQYKSYRVFNNAIIRLSSIR